MTMVVAFRRSCIDDAKPEIDEVRDIGFRTGDDLEVVRLVLLGDADLEEPVELRPVLAATLAHLAEPFDVGEAQDRREARARNAPMTALALPVGQPEGFEARHRGRRRGAVEP